MSLDEETVKREIYTCKVFLPVKNLLIVLGLERLCACTSDGTLHFFITAEEEDSAEEKEDVDDVTMGSEDSCISENAAPSTSTSSTS